VPDAELAELASALRRFRAGGHAVDRVVGAVCAVCAGCGGRVFGVDLDDEEGCGERVCAGCGAQWLMLDSADTIGQADLVECACPCGGERFRVAVGFAMAPSTEVRWVSVGLRCVADGFSGVHSDWKIDYEPSRHLLERV
jgi:hypothetical protein